MTASSVVSSVLAQPQQAKVVGLKTRSVSNVLRERGHLTRQEIFDLVSHDIIPSKSNLTKILNIMIKKKRIKSFLPKGALLGKDPFAFKLNPTRNHINFPEIFGKKQQKSHLAWMLSKDKTGQLHQLIENTPAPANKALKELRKKIASLKNAI